MWRWAGACAIGTSHIKAGLECQDRASCRSVQTCFGPVIVVVVSDGAGSARKAAAGANIVCMEMHRRIARYLRGGYELEKIDKECVADWIDSIRDKISHVANAAALRPRDFAATLVALLADRHRAVVVHIGDGAVTVRDHKTKEWSVPSWPFHGEYASTTRFVIDDPHPQFEIAHIEATIDRFAIFSDGVENLFLDQRGKFAPAPFFERLLQPVSSWQGQGRNRKLSAHLRNYLNSENICAETDDDKSLILGARL
ncbi:MAG: PP2C family serine/threonine-protein phosphatase [Beijerinckiaceae bacterium]